MKLDQTIRLDAYSLITRAIEEGVRYGMNRAYKYNDKPTREEIEEQVERAVMGSLCEILKFDSGEEPI